jgi:predicted lipoprotein with Yx(FWY)xxD motif
MAQLGEALKGGIVRATGGWSRRSAVFVVVALVVAFVAALSAGATVSGGATVKTRVTKLGRMLVNARGRSLYLFEKDRHGKSACYGPCAKSWPPLLTRGKPIAGPGVKAKLLGVTMRKNGTHQVTYNHHPLYRYSNDEKAGQTEGEASKLFGAEWYVVAPSGKKIDNS